MVQPCLIRFSRSSESRQRIYAFSSAGGNAFDYRSWSRRLPDSVELLGVQLAGRSSRFSEPPAEGVEEILDEVVPALDLDKPFLLFGHSFGGLLAYETAQRLTELGQADNLFGLWASETYPPNAIPADEPIHERDDLLQVVSSRFNAIPDAILNEPEMAEIVTRALRADYRALERYVHRRKVLLGCDVTVVTAYAGDQPVTAQPGWEHETQGAVIHHAFKGGHFYLREPEHEAALCRLMVADLVGHETG